MADWRIETKRLTDDSVIYQVTDGRAVVDCTDKYGANRVQEALQKLEDRGDIVEITIIG